MASKIYTTTILGIEAVRVDVEAQITKGKRRFSIVGLPDGVLREARDRVRCAIENCGFEFPDQDVVVSLSPAALPKAGSAFDLAIALSVLAAGGHLRRHVMSDVLFCGELSLSGDVRACSGVLASACLASKRCWRLVAHPDALRATLAVPDIHRIPLTSLAEVVRWINVPNEVRLRSLENSEGSISNELASQFSSGPDFHDVIGQTTARRAAVIAAAGRHNLFFVGPPGSGKSMLAARLPSILPRLTDSEALEVAKVRGAHSSAHGGGAGSQEVYLDKLVYDPPFRAPHHTTSCAGLIGGGSTPVPGELSLAHLGVLFLDELLEFRRDTVEALRQPLEDRKVVIRRVHFRATYPADVMLVAAANPCPCGMQGGSQRCECSSQTILRYRQRMSGPLLDRIDLQVWVPPVTIRELHSAPAEFDPSADPTKGMRETVLRARARQLQRISEGLQKSLNYSLGGISLRRVCQINVESERLLEVAATRLGLTARGHSRVLKVARTIADIEASDSILTPHIAEALSYRLAEWGGNAGKEERSTRRAE